MTQKHIRRSFDLIFPAVAFLLVFGTFQTHAGKIQPVTGTKRITLKLERASFGDVVRELNLKYDVMIGFEESLLDVHHNDYDFDTNVRFSNHWRPNFKVKENWITIDVQDEPLESILNLIVGQMRHYQWSINDDVVNIYPTKGRNPIYKNLLELAIADFTIRKDNPILGLRMNVFALPEVEEFLEANSLRTSPYRRDRGALLRPLPYKISLQDVTLRELLNGVARIKQGGWILKRNKLQRAESETDEYIEIDI